MTWYVLGIIAIVSLIVHWRKRGAVWGGLTIGIFIGLIVSLFNVFKGKGFGWIIVGKGAALGTITGLLAELLGKAGDHFKRTKS